jgi:tRNA(Ile)-lysidine synthase
MDVVLPSAGKYVVAVSGGVDSMALLHLLSEQPGVKLTVAHFDHGIREDSTEDRRLVQSAAKEYDLPFVYHEARLGERVSEATARQARYQFLHQVQKSSNARAIITAHHQDDVLETAIINLIRGTGRKGLTALSSRPDIVRPLLDIPKQDIINYAKGQDLDWREDSTNQDLKYLRNYVRHKLLPRFKPADRLKLVNTISNLRAVNHELDSVMASQFDLQDQAGRLDRQWFNQLPHNVAREVLAAWLRAANIRNFDSRMLERLVVAAKVAPAGKIFHVLGGSFLEVKKDYLALA